MKSLTCVIAFLALFFASCNQPSKDSNANLLLNSGTPSLDAASKDSAAAIGTLTATAKTQVANVNASATCPSFASFNDIKANHKVPQWLKDSRFGIYIHYGLYSVAAYHNEWYARHMYCNQGIKDWHAAKFGKNFGYKDFIPSFATKFNANEWASAFKASGAGFVVLSAEHHDRFALWDSKVTKWCAGQMGAKHDVVGELAAACRAQGMKFGCGNHRMYGYSFQWCGASADQKVDLYDPAYADLYGDGAGGPPNGGCDIDVGGCKAGHPTQGWLTDWVARNKELIDKYQVDMLWYDWDGQGSNNATKLAVASYYYEQACKWGKEVTLAGKGGVFPGDQTASGSNIMMLDYETGNRAPKAGSEPPNFWLVDDKITTGIPGHTTNWCYIEGTGYRTSSSIISQIDDYKKRGGLLLLNVAPKGDGTIPSEQIAILNDIGKHFNVGVSSVIR